MNAIPLINNAPKFRPDVNVNVNHIGGQSFNPVSSQMGNVMRQNPYGNETQLRQEVNTSIVALKREAFSLENLIAQAAQTLQDVNNRLSELEGKQGDYVKKSDVVDSITSGNMNPVTSNAVANSNAMPVNSVTSGNMHSVTSNAVFKASSPNFSQAQLIYRGNEEYNNNSYTVPDNGYLIGSGYGSDYRSSWIYFYLPNGVSLLKQGWGDENICNCAPVRKGDVVRIWSYLKLNSQGIYFVPCN